MIHDDDDAVLVKERPSATYELLLQKAIKEGRVGGKHQCPLCGMSYHKKREAQECCAKTPVKR